MTNFIDKRNTAERCLLLIVLCLTIYLLFNALLFSPVSKKHSTLQKKIQLTQNKTNLLKTQIKAINTRVNSPFVKQLKTERTALNDEINALEEQIYISTQNMSSRQRTITLLKTLLKDIPELKLVHFSTKLKMNKNTPPVELFEHQYTIKLEGRYFSVLRYLEKLEQSKQFIFWDSLHYEVKKYPKALITLKMHTLSTEDSLIND